MDPGYRMRKLWLWGIRQGITVTLAVVFWEHTWVRWAFAAAVLLALSNLGLLLFGGRYLQRRVERTRERIAATEAAWDEEEERSEGVDDNVQQRTGE